MPCILVRPSASLLRPWHRASRLKIRPYQGGGNISAPRARTDSQGQQRMPIVTKEGMEPKVVYQVAEVSRPPIALSATCDRGNVIVYGASGGFIHNLSTGARTHFGGERGICELDL